MSWVDEIRDLPEFKPVEFEHGAFVRILDAKTMESLLSKQPDDDASRDDHQLWNAQVLVAALCDEQGRSKLNSVDEAVALPAPFFQRALAAFIKANVSTEDAEGKSATAPGSAPVSG